MIGGPIYGVINPLIGPLTHNGGLTPTHALLPGSLALDAGDPGVSLDPNRFDQRGTPFHRVATGVVLGIPTSLVDISAYEAQSPPSADFVDDDITNGADFLAWQRGFGTADAVRTDGNSDDDSDVDRSDLAAWRATYRQTQIPPPPVSAAVGRQSTVSGAALIDAAMALERFGGVFEYQEALKFATIDLPASPVLSTTSSLDDSSLPVDDERRVSMESSTEADDQELPWLTEELLERSLG